MNWKARVQAWATLVAAIALPALYVGGTQHLPALSAVGLIVFTGSLLACPALRFVRAPRGHGADASADGASARQTAATPR